MKKILCMTLLLTCFSMPLFAQDVKLPTPNLTGGKAVIDTIKERKSTSEIAENQKIDFQSLSDLLWCAYGFNREDRRVIPTALNRQEIDVYVILEEGAYLYDAKDNRLILKTPGDHRTKAGKQDYVYTAPVNLIYVTDKSKDTWTGAYISCGCATQNVYLACASKGLACRVRTSIDKDALHELLKLEEHQEAMAGQTIGYMKNFEVQPLGESLPRASMPEQFPSDAKNSFFAELAEKNMDLHSLMIVQNGKVVCEQWFGENAPGKNHVLWSVSKTYTSMAVGFAVAEGRITVEDKVISFFPDDLPEEISDNLKDLKIKDLLSMSVGHDTDPTGPLLRGDDTSGISWEKRFFSHPIPHKPGTKFVYNSLATYMLSSIVQKVTGEKIADYLKPRLFDPLGIDGAVWDVNPQGVNVGGWGLHVKTEDMAKLGQLLLQKGHWKGQQILPESWVEEATTKKILQNPDVDPTKSESDWVQGYCYQMWRCRNDAFRADGMAGQFILVLPKENAVIVITANIGDMQAELNLVWKHLLPALQK